MLMVEGMELLMIASGPLVGGIVGMIVDGYPAPSLEGEILLEGERLLEGEKAPKREEVAEAEQRPILRRLHSAIEVACTAAAALAAVALPPPLSLFATALGWVLLALALIDLRHLEVPDTLSLPLIPGGLAATWWIDPQAILMHAAAAAAGAGAIWLLGEAYRRLRGHAGIGGGDVRLFAVAGAWVGLAELPEVLFLSGAFGLIAAAILVRRGWVDWGDRIPFVPALAVALWVVILVPELVQP
jgi:leader peptidase (prepilin peptidase)/N-methyltransferase